MNMPAKKMFLWFDFVFVEFSMLRIYLPRLHKIWVYSDRKYARFSVAYADVIKMRPIWWSNNEMLFHQNSIHRKFYWSHLFFYCCRYCSRCWLVAFMVCGLMYCNVFDFSHISFFGRTILRRGKISWMLTSVASLHLIWLHFFYSCIVFHTWVLKTVLNNRKSVKL